MTARNLSRNSAGFWYHISCHVTDGPRDNDSRTPSPLELVCLPSMARPGDHPELTHEPQGVFAFAPLTSTPGNGRSGMVHWSYFMNTKATGQSRQAARERTPSLTFNNVEFQIHHVGAIECVTADQVSKAIGYADEKSIHRLYNRNADEFTGHMTGVVNLTTPGGQQETRVFSLRGAHLLGMLAKTEQAKQFRRWILDLIEFEESQRGIPEGMYAQALEAETAEARSFAMARHGSHLMLIRKAEKKELQEQVSLMREFIQLKLALSEVTA